MSKILFSIQLLFFYSLFTIHHSPLHAQTSPSLNAAEIELQLQKLNVLGSVLYIAAHPDDENTRLLAYLANEKHYRTGYLSLTRGDGGQNLIGNEQGELLGLIRTQELLAARKVDGAEQFFTRANDFGYSKNPEETFAIWGKEKILADVVYVIRKFQPDVIITRFPTTGEGGHGHHTASAILAQEAFTAAADPKRFPEQLQYVKVWQAKRLLWNTFKFGSANTTSEDQFHFDVGVYNKLLGKSYGEIAAESRTNHKSQGFGSLKTRGEQMEYFKTIAGDAPQHDLMDGVNTTWSRIETPNTIQASVNKIISEYTPEKPEASVVSLIDVDLDMRHLPDNYWKTQKQKEVEQLIVACSGLWFEAYSNSTSVSSGQTLNWNFQVVKRCSFQIMLRTVSLQNFDTTMDKALSENELFSFKHTQALDLKTSITQPYWLVNEKSLGTFSFSDQSLAGKPENDPPVIAYFMFRIAGIDFTFPRPLVYKYEDPVRGEVYRPLEVAPQVMVNIEEPVYLFSNNISKEVKVTIKSAITNAKGAAKLFVPKGWNISPANFPFELKNAGDETSVTFLLTPPAGSISASVDTLRAVLEMNGTAYNRGIKTIAYDHIPAITIFPVAKSKLVAVPLKITGKNIGYVKGAGDFVPEMLREVGYKVSILSDDDIASGNLQQYDAIITGVRLYNTNQRMNILNGKLFEYVKNGGTLLTQYNTTADLVTEKMGPYPFKLSRERVTDENAKVNFIDPKNPILNSPNKITDQDFEGWIQERGLYFLTAVDSNYQKVFTMNDPNESPLDGSLIVAKYGEGKFVYTGLSFFRELPAGVPGAFRLFVNLISKNELPK
ncbi:MAG TPA: PIG-L family deacetylase [Chitinophagales bacterium]|nr:PIG-L family deacetylase [Chitinophagales bacterium]